MAAVKRSGLLFHFVNIRKMNDVKFSDLLGLTISKIDVNTERDRIEFTISDGRKFLLHHIQDCCERVSIEDIEGELGDLLNTPILQADESTNCEDTFGKIEYPDSFTWTFYKLATINGYVTIRWLGESNGYYSESVDFCELSY